MTQTLPQVTQTGAERGAARRSPSKPAVFALTVAVCLACDRLTKLVARRELSLEPRSVLAGLIRLEYAENRGAFMSLGSALPDDAHLVFLFLLAAVVIGVLVVLALRGHSLNLLQFTGLSLVAAGGCGNLIDRILYHGRVVDWVSVGFGWLRTGVFNLADVAVIGGALMFLLSGVRERRQEGDDRP